MEATALQVFVGKLGGFSSTRGALDETLHDKEWFVDFFHSAGVFTDCSRDGGDSNGAATEFVDDGDQYLVVDLVQTVFVDVESL